MKNTKESTEEDIPINSGTKKTFFGIFAILLASTLLLSIFSAYWVFQIKNDLNEEMTGIAQSLMKIENNTLPKPSQAGELITLFDKTNLTLTYLYDGDFNVSLYRKAYIYYNWISGNPDTQWDASFVVSNYLAEHNTFFLSTNTYGVLELEIKGPILNINQVSYSGMPSDPKWLVISLSIYLTY